MNWKSKPRTAVTQLDMTDGLWTTTIKPSDCESGIAEERARDTLPTVKCIHRGLVLAVLLFQLSSCAPSARVKRLSNAEYWAAASNPTSQTPEAVGNYGGGCLNGGLALRTDGEGFTVMRLSRNRYYGHPELISFIESLGRSYWEKESGTLLVGDLSQPRGGPMKTGHRSHQIGLDADIWFRALPKKTKGASITLAAADRESFGSPSVVQGEFLHKEHWGKHSQTALQLAAEHPKVDRIFVNPVIKRELCIHLPASGRAWLRKIRPWWGHDSHFHVRLQCPDRSPRCRPTGELPPGDGCDETLNWWFSEEAMELGKSSEPPELPILPIDCEAVLNQQ